MNPQTIGHKTHLVETRVYILLVACTLLNFILFITGPVFVVYCSLYVRV